MVFSMLSNQLASSHTWGIPLSAILPSNPTKSSSCGFVCPPARHPSVAMTPLPTRSSTSITSTSSSNTIVASSSKLQSTNKKYSAEWIDLLSSDSYSSSSSPIPLPNKIDPPRSGAVSVSDNGQQLVTFGGYAEVASTSDSMPPERFVVNDLWKFVPYQEQESNTSQESSSSSWGWNKVSQNEKEEYIPGPRLATALAVLPSSNNDDSNNNAVLLGGWDPQTAGTGGIILEDVTMLDMDSLVWSQYASTIANDDDDDDQNDNNQVTIPGGPTSRHVAVPLSIQSNNDDSDNVRHVICLHNHRCNDHVLLFSDTSSSKEGSMCDAKWEHRPTTGDVPSSRGLHCAMSLAYGLSDDDNDANTSTKAMVIFGGAAKDGNMSNEVFVLDVRSWKWTRLDCSSSAGDGDDDDADDADDIPTPRAGACLCPLDENSVLLFGGAMPATADEGGGLLGLNDVWVLRIDMEHGKGKWECLIRSQSVVDNDEDNNDVVRPPGRNAATLCAIDAGKFLPNMKAGTECDDGKSSCFLLQGGWYPFRKTYDDVFLLRINSSE